MDSNKEEIRDFYVQLGIVPEQFELDDEAYVFPSRQWIAEVFAPAWDACQTILGIGKWTQDENDCEDRAKQCERYAKILYLKSQQVPRGKSLYWPVYKYLKNPPDRLSGHAINATIVEGSDGAAEHVTFEPQYPPRIVQLTREQNESCIGIFG